MSIAKELRALLDVQKDKFIDEEYNAIIKKCEECTLKGFSDFLFDISSEYSNDIIERLKQEDFRVDIRIAKDPNIFSNNPKITIQIFW